MNRTALFVIPAYLLIVTVFVGYVGSKMKSYKDFALGGGTLPCTSSPEPCLQL